jgi:hypothetical protein
MPRPFRISRCVHRVVNASNLSSDMGLETCWICWIVGKQGKKKGTVGWWDSWEGGVYHSRKSTVRRRVPRSNQGQTQELSNIIEISQCGYQILSASSRRDPFKLLVTE